MLFLRRPSEQATAVVVALAEEPAAWRYGYELCQRLDLRAGSLYPAPMGPAGRLPRHLYRLTGPGRVLAGRLAAEPPPVPPAGQVRPTA
jgi:PadR family transcriptional regulator, regulatory protein PadR